MRGILVDWLVEVAEEYKLSAENLYLSTNYVDRFLSVMPVLRGRLQLVGVTCMLIASKYEEIFAPQVEDFVYITDSTYAASEVLHMEVTVLNALRFNLSAVTPHCFLRRLTSVLAFEEQVSAHAPPFSENDFFFSSFRKSWGCASRSESETLCCGFLLSNAASSSERIPGRDHDPGVRLHPL